MIRFMLKTKLSLAIIITIVCFGFLTTGYIYINSQKNIMGYASRSLQDLAKAKADEISQIFKNSERFVGIIASQSFVLDYINNESKILQDPIILENLNHFNIADAYSAIYIMDLNGDTLVSTDSSFVGKNYAFRDYFVQAKQGNPWVYTAVGVTSGELGFYFSYPIKEDNKIIGVAVVKLRPNFVAEAVYNRQNGDEKKIILADENGVVLLSSSQDEILSTLYELPSDKTKNLVEIKRYPDGFFSPLSYIDFKEVIESGSNDKLKSPIILEDEREKSLNEMVKLENYSLYLLFSEPLGQYFDDITFLTIFVGGFTVLSALCALLIVLVLLYIYLKPLDKLKKFAEGISQGDYDERIIINSRDEFESVAEAFNTMSEQVKQSQLALKKEQKNLVEKVAQLEKMNKMMVGREKKMAELKRQIKSNQ